MPANTAHSKRTDDAVVVCDVVAVVVSVVVLVVV